MIGTLRASATYNLLTARSSQIEDVKSRLNEASLEVATGLKADVYKSLGYGASEVLALRGQLNRNDGYITSNNLLASKLDVTAQTLSGIRDIAQGFLDVAILNTDAPTASASDLQAAAITALEQLTGQINGTYQSSALFSGIDSDQRPLQTWTGVNATTGLSPSDVLASVIGGGITNVTDATQKVDAVIDIYASADAVLPNRNFEATFYNGSPLLDFGGLDTPRLQAQIDKNTTLSYGVQANDPAFTDVLRGLAMIAGTDVSMISDGQAYEVWMGSAVNALSNGINGLIKVEADLGTQQQQLDERITAQQNMADIFNARVNKLEGVDLFEASNRVLQLENQLQATYTMTARLSQLTFLDFI